MATLSGLRAAAWRLVPRVHGTAAAMPRWAHGGAADSEGDAGEAVSEPTPPPPPSQFVAETLQV